MINLQFSLTVYELSVFSSVSRLAYTFDDSSVRNKFSQYEGGSVDLNKDSTSGIAVIKLNNPKRKNALTGNTV